MADLPVVALAMDGGTTTRWFGFSPPVVVVALVVIGLVVGIAWTKRGDDYLGQVQEVCDATQAEMKKSFVDSFYGDLLGIARTRRAMMRQITPPPRRRAEHEAILAEEDGIIALMEPLAATPIREYSPELRAASKQWGPRSLALEARYAVLGLGRCSR